MKVQIVLVVLGFVAGIGAAPVNGEQIKVVCGRSLGSRRRSKC